MKYYFILGNNPALSLAELISVLKPKEQTLLEPDFLLLELDQEIDAPSLMNHLGGVIKIGQIKEELKLSELKSDILSTCFKLALDKKKLVPSGKFNFGLSNYSKSLNLNNNLGLELKNEFKKKEISSRLVTSRDKKLSSVVITQNKLVRKGIELVFIIEDDKALIGETLAVQPFKSLSYRDYSRPARDDKSGMLPPKLAQIMLNLAETKDRDAVICDPFCGSGTVITEAMLMNYKSLLASDKSPKAMDDTRKNIEWIRDKYDIKDARVKFLVKSSLDLSKFVKSESVDAIVTEPYLGPQRGQLDFERITSELEYLYSHSIEEFYKVLKPGGRVVMVWPMFYGSRLINPSISKFKLISPLSKDLGIDPIIKKYINSRGNIVYGRPGQKVFREIVILEK